MKVIMVKILEVIYKKEKWCLKWQASHKILTWRPAIKNLKTQTWYNKNTLLIGSDQLNFCQVWNKEKKQQKSKL